MYFDLRMKYGDQREKKRIKEIEDNMKERVEMVRAKIKEEFSDYVSSFGITGPMAHGEGTIFFSDGKILGSDMDFAVVTKFISPRKEKKLRNEIKNIFFDSPVEEGTLVFSPSIFEKPDLMFIEYANEGKVLFGKKIKCKENITVWEAAKVLTSRSGALLNSISFNKRIRFSDEFLYGWSKSVIGAAESMLILEKKYDYSVRGVSKNIHKSKMAKEIHNFLKLFKRAYLYRYSGKIACDRKKILEDTSTVLSIMFEKVAEKMAEKSGKDVSELRAHHLSTAISTRFFYFIDTLKQGKIKIPISEPLVKEFVKMGEIFELLKNGKMPDEKQRQEAVHLWKHAGRFWLPY